MSYRILKVVNKYYVQKRAFLFFWTNCYIYGSDYSRRVAVYNTEEDAYSYFKLKNFLED